MAELANGGTSTGRRPARENAAGGGRQRQALARKRLRVLEHVLERFVDADQRCHDVNATACSRARPATAAGDARLGA